MANKWEIKVHKEDPNNKRADYSNSRKAMYCPFCGKINDMRETAHIYYTDTKDFFGNAISDIKCSCGLSYFHSFAIMGDTLEIAQEKIERFFDEANQKWETRYKEI